MESKENIILGNENEKLNKIYEIKNLINDN